MTVSCVPSGTRNTIRGIVRPRKQSTTAARPHDGNSWQRLQGGGGAHPGEDLTRQTHGYLKLKEKNVFSLCGVHAVTVPLLTQLLKHGDEEERPDDERGRTTSLCAPKDVENGRRPSLHDFLKTFI